MPRPAAVARSAISCPALSSTEVARSCGAVDAYQAYPELFNTAAAPISAILRSLDRFYVFLGLGPVQAAKR